MSNVQHHALTGSNIHVVHAFVYADASARNAATLTPEDVGKIALQSDEKSFWILAESSPTTWSLLGSGTIFVGGADPSATYLVLNATGSLNNERVLLVSGASGLKATDNGPGSSFFLQIDDSVVATLSGSTFTGPINASGGLSGSLQRLITGESTFVGVGGVSITTSSIGQILISGSTVRQHLAGTGVIVSDVTISVDPNLVVMRSGSLMTGPLIASAGLTGSLQKTVEGLSYLVGIGGISIASQSNGQIVISGSSGGSSNPPVAGTGINVVGTTVSINDNIVATVSGARFTGPVLAAAGFTGSLQLVSPGVPYLLSQGGITLTTMSNGQIIISGASGGSGGSNPTAGLGIIVVGSQVSINDNVVATLTGSRFTGLVETPAGLSSSFIRANRFSGSLTTLESGASYLVAQGAISIISQSSGQIVISSSGDTTVAGNGLIKNGNSLLVNDNVVATVSGASFTGVVNAGNGLSGSLQRTTTGLSYLVGAGGVSITSQSNGQIIISSSIPQATTSGQGIIVLNGQVSVDPNIVAMRSGSSFQSLSASIQQLPSGLSYLVGAGAITVASQSNGQIIISGSGDTTVAGLGLVKAGNSLLINDNVVATVSGTTFVGTVQASAGLSGSLQRTTAGLSYLVGGGNVSITSQSNGQIVISGSSDLTLAGTGLIKNSTILSINDNVVATVSGTRFTGPVVAAGGLSGSLQQTSAGLSFLVAGANVTITSQSNGQIVVSSTALSTGSANVTWVDGGSKLKTTSSVAISANDNYADSIGNDVFLYVSGTIDAPVSQRRVAVFGGDAIFSGSIRVGSGSVTVTSNTVQFSDAGTRIERSGSHLRFYDQNNPAGLTLTALGAAGGGGGGGGDADVGYLVVALTGSLNNERALSAGTGINFVDAGANSTFTISINNGVVATLSGSTFSGPVSASNGLSGSLQRIGPNLPYLLSQGGITLTTQSNGQIVISSSIPQNPTAGTGITVAGTQVSINNNVVATVSGTTFTGPVIASGGLSGSLQRLSTGETAFAGAGGISVVTQSNGQILISGTIPTALQAGSGITLTNNTVSIDPNVVVTRSGSSITGQLVLSGGVTGSLQKTIEGLSYLVGVGGTSIISQSNGQIFISSSTPQNPSAGTGIIVVGTQVSVDPNIVATRSGSSFQRLSASIQQTDTGLSYLVAAGAISITSQSNGQIIISGSGDTTSAGAGLIKTNNALSINDNVVATVSGTRFTGPVSASAGFTGSLQLVSPGIPFLLSQGGITLTTMSNGQIIISGAVGGGSSPPTAGAGILVNGTQVSINDNVVATLSGSIFGGRTIFSGGLTGSLQQTLGGLSYLVGAGGTIITSQSNGQIIVSSSAAQGPSAGTGVLVNGFQVSINDNVVATVSGTRFTGPVSASAGFTGSLQLVSPGIPYLLSQGGITLTTMSNGQIIISGAVAGGAAAPSAGTGIIVVGSQVSINDNVVATLSGSTFTGVVNAGGGLSGSLQRTTSGLSYLQGVGGTSIVSQSNGQIFVSSSVPQKPIAGTGITVSDVTVSVDPNAVAMRSGSSFQSLSASIQQLPSGLSYLVAAGAISIVSQSNGQIVISGSGDTTVAGLGLIKSSNSLFINDSVVATLSGSTFTGPVLASTLSGSLQRTTAGLSYLVGVGGTTITSQSNGQIFVSSSAPQNPTAGTGIIVAGTQVSVDPNIVAMRSGSSFQSLSASIQRIPSGLSYLVAAGAITITSQSNGQIVISGSGDTTAVGTGLIKTGNTLSINDNVVATVSGTRFTGPVSASAGFTGSLQLVSPGIPYLLSQGGITLTTMSNGQIIISGSNGGAGSAPTAGTGILVNGTQVSINNNVVATVSGTTFTGPVSASGGLSGSLQQVGPNLSYLVANQGITITSASNGQVFVFAAQHETNNGNSGTAKTINWRASSNQRVTLDASPTFTFLDPPMPCQLQLRMIWASASMDPTWPGSVIWVLGSEPTWLPSSGAVNFANFFYDGSGSYYGVGTSTIDSDTAATYLVLSSTSSLANERVLNVSGASGLIMNDAGAGSTLSLSINNNVVATVSGTRFTGPVSASAGFTGSLQLVSPGIPFLLSQGGITLTTMSNGQIIISGSSGGAGSNPTAGTGILVNGTQVSINNNVVATLTGSTFSGPVLATGGLSGSLQRTTAGLPYLLSQGGITLTTMSNGQIIISGAVGSGGTSTPSGWIDGGNRLKTTSSVSLSGPSDVYANQIGSDVFFYVSGTLGISGSGVQRAVFGGDVYHSGSVKVAKSVVFTNEIDFGNKGSASPQFDFRLGQKFRAILTGSLTASFVDPDGACNIQLMLIQDSAGNRTVSWPPSVKWPNSGTIPTLSSLPNSIDIASFYYNGSGSYFGVATLQFK